MQDYAELLKLLQGQQEEPNMSEEVVNVDPALQAPEEVETVANAARGIASAEATPVISDMETEQANQDAKSPNMKTKQELAEDQMPSELDENIAKYKQMLSEKPKELTWKDKLADYLSAAHNIMNYSQGSPQKMMSLGHVDKLRAQQSAQRKEKLGNQKTLIDLLRRKQELDKKGQLSKKDQEYLDYYKSSLGLRKKQLEATNKRQQKSFEQKDVDRKLKAEDKIYKVIADYEKHPMVKELDKQGLSFDQADSLIEQMREGNQVALGALGTKMARAMGEVGVLTDMDVKRYVQAQSLVQKAQDMYGKNFKGKLSPETIKDIEEVTAKMKKGFSKKRKSLYDRYIKRAYENYGKTAKFSLEDIETRFAMPSMAEMEEEVSSEFSPAQERGIERVMESNNVSREVAIKALKDAGKL